jgi:hypothetical protein
MGTVGRRWRVAELHDATAEYPPAPGTVLVARLWEASFLLEVARKALPRADAAYVAGCLFRIVVLCAHALHGHAGQWLINEKGAVDGAGRLLNAPRDFAVRARRLLGRRGTSANKLRAALDASSVLVDETIAACKE